MLSHYTESMIGFIKFAIRQLSFAFAGIWFVLKNEFAFQWNVSTSALVIALFIFFMNPLSQTEYILLGFAWVLIVITELQNTAIENALDRLHPEQHESIGRSKDMAAGAVLMAGLFLIFVMVMIYFL